jgi:hypothetical protein
VEMIDDCIDDVRLNGFGLIGRIAAYCFSFWRMLACFELIFYVVAYLAIFVVIFIAFDFAFIFAAFLLYFPFAFASASISPPVSVQPQPSINSHLMTLTLVAAVYFSFIFY